MGGDDLWVAYGVAPCKRGQHSLRTRTGSCIQCGTAQLAFVKRWHGPGYIYVAYSKELKRTKIGVTTDPEKRIQSLNRIGYGAANDWSLFDSSLCANMGFIEHQMHTKISAHRASAYYWRDGYLVDCKELFNYPAAKAWKLVVKALEAAA